jgi:hypothetical protein
VNLLDLIALTDAAPLMAYPVFTADALIYYINNDTDAFGTVVLAR